MVLAVAALIAAAIGPASAARTTGDIVTGIAPVWISIPVPPYTLRFMRRQSRLPPQIEHVLMLQLDQDPETAAEAAVDALLAAASWKRPAGDAVTQGPYGPYLPFGAGAIAAASLMVLMAARRLRRTRRG